MSGHWPFPTYRQRPGSNRPDREEVTNIDEPTAAQHAKEVFAISRDEILLGRNVAWRHFSRMMTEIDGLVAAFEDGRFAEIKCASEKIGDAAQAAADTTRQIKGLAMSLGTGCAHQLNRRSRP